MTWNFQVSDMAWLNFLRAGAAENEEEKLLQHYLLLMRRLRCNFKALDIFGRQ